MSKEVNEERTPRTVEDVKEMLSKHSNGEIQRTIQNCITILQNDHVLADAIRLNLLSERIDIVKPVGWPRSGKPLNDTDMKYILRRMEKYGISMLTATLSTTNLFDISSKKLKGQTPIQSGFSNTQLSERPTWSLSLSVSF